MYRFQNWKYKNTGLLVCSLVLLFLFADAPAIKNIISGIGALGYAGMFLAGMFFVSIFTVAPASVVLLFFTRQYAIWQIAGVAGLGAVMGDYLIFRFLKDGVFEELRPVFSRFVKFPYLRLFQTPYFSWIIPILGAIIIASPLPDEVGIGILGLSKVKSWQFMLISFALNAAGIFVILSLAEVLT